MFNFIINKIKRDKIILILFILIKLLISFFPVEYGIFRDEFYYLAMSENLDFGYLDVPPLAPFLLAVVRLFLGVSYFSLHLLPAISGCLILYLSYLIVKKFKCTIIVENYGEAGAIEYYGKKYNLPKPVSGHLQYYVWGDRGYTGEVAIVLGWRKEEVKTFYDDVIQTGEVYHKYAMPYENNQPIYVCKNLKVPFKEILKKIKNFS